MLQYSRRPHPLFVLNEANPVLYSELQNVFQDIRQHQYRNQEEGCFLNHLQDIFLLPNPSFAKRVQERWHSRFFRVEKHAGFLFHRHGAPKHF